MRIATGILKDVPGAAKRRLGANHPLGASGGSQMPRKRRGSLERSRRIEETQAPGVKGHLELRRKQPTKQPREHAYRQEEARTAGNERSPSVLKPPPGATQCRCG